MTSGHPHQAWALREGANPGPRSSGNRLPLVWPRKKAMTFVLEKSGPVNHPSSLTCSLGLDTHPSSISIWTSSLQPQPAHLTILVSGGVHATARPPTTAGYCATSGDPALAWDPRRVCAKSMGRFRSSPNKYLAGSSCHPLPSQCTVRAQHGRVTDNPKQRRTHPAGRGATPFLLPKILVNLHAHQRGPHV